VSKVFFFSFELPGLIVSSDLQPPFPVAVQGLGLLRQLTCAVSPDELPSHLTQFAPTLHVPPLTEAV
jgi:hypothetical protein